MSAPVWLGWMGRVLVYSDPLQPADAILVLAGDWKGERIIQACELARSGVAPVVLVSGPMKMYLRNEADLAVEFAVSKGCPANLLQPVYIRAFSTDEEARSFRAELERRGIRRLLVVTSNYHTARSRRIFRRRLGPAIEVRTWAAADTLFDPNDWWRTRGGQKTAFYEWSKTIATAVGL